MTVLLFACLQAPARNLWAFLTYSTFNSPEGSYVETYLTIAGNSVRYQKLDNGTYQATINILMTFRQGIEIKAFSKYELKSPEIQDTTSADLYFNHQDRFFLPNGTFDFEIQLADQNSSVKPVPFSQAITVDFPTDKPSFSGIELIKSYSKATKETAYSKSGYDLIPNVFTFYPEKENRLTFYAELYGIEQAIGKDEKFLITYYFESYEGNIRLLDFARSRKETARPVNVMLTEFNIENLATGNYNLVLEARNNKSELMASKKLFFQRINPNTQFNMSELVSLNIRGTFVESITNPDTLREYISCTYPVASGLEKSFVKNSLRAADLKTMQQYFYNFWYRRNEANPYQAWLTYKAQVAVAQENFGTPVKKGYQTDRGRVFLQYGPPNAREVHYMEPSSLPYEIWQYYTLNETQRNKKFVFYSPDMVTSDFYLLHSDAIGEIYEPRWKVFLRSKLFSPIDLQDDQVIRSWGDFEEDAWTLPTTNL
jgi:GWxTD domain-containing protein